MIHSVSRFSSLFWCMIPTFPVFSGEVKDELVSLKVLDNLSKVHTSSCYMNQVSACSMIVL